MLVVETHSPAETRQLAARFSQELRENARIALIGGLGAGKTVFVQGLARGLGIRESITSPTFVLIKSYTGRLRLHHCDWYRMNSANDIESSGFDDLEFDPGVIVVEWADRLEDALEKPHLHIEFQPIGSKDRRIRFSVCGRSPALDKLIYRFSK